MKKLVPILIVLIIAAGAVITYFFTIDNESNTNIASVTQNTNIATETSTFVDSLKTPKALALTFAEYEPAVVDVNPSVPTIDLKDDLSNLHNKDQISSLLYDSDTKDQFLDNGFIITPGWNDEFFSLYETHRYNYVPSFVTTDSLLHNYHLLFDHLLRQTEEDFLIENLKELNASMVEVSLEQYNTLKNTDWEMQPEEI